MKLDHRWRHQTGADRISLCVRLCRTHFVQKKEK